LIDGSEAAPATVLAHGAGAAIDSPFMAAMASGMAGNWATAPGESSPRCLSSPLAVAAAFEQDPAPPTEPASVPVSWSFVWSPLAYAPVTTACSAFAGDCGIAIPPSASV